MDFIKSSVKNYVPKNLQQQITTSIYPDLTIDDIDEIDNGTVVFDYSSDRTGVYNDNGDLCKNSVLLRFSEKTIANVNRHIKKCDFINETVIYLGTGYVFEHFGHFLTEGINRFWPLLYPKYKKCKVVIALRNKNNIPEFVRKMLNAMGVEDKDIIVVGKNTRFAKIFVPYQSTNINVKILSITKSVYDKIGTVLEDKNIKTFDKIYMSRSAMNDGRTFGEKQIEKIFEKNGYKIIYPEQLSLEHQITLVRSCKEMAGTAGSALHLAFFMKPGCRVVQIKRNSTVSDNINIQNMIDAVSGLETILVYGSIETYKTNHFTSAPQILGVTPEMLKFFQDYNFKYEKSDIDFDNAEFNRYLRQLRKYKRHKFYKKVFDLPIRIISLLGITKHGREIIREHLRMFFHI